jgi:glucan phosphoethanolaminetransferase (alkaline phosphatase superfamily)
MAIENEYNKLDKQGKDKVILFITSQLSLIILGILLGFNIIIFLSKSITIPTTKILLLMIMMAICMVIYYKSTGSVNSNKEK